MNNKFQLLEGCSLIHAPHSSNPNCRVLGFVVPTKKIEAYFNSGFRGALGLLDEMRKMALNGREEDVVRVLRVLEYVGHRSDVERQVNNSIHGQKTFGPDGRPITIRAATLGTYPEILHGYPDADPDQNP